MLTVQTLKYSLLGALFATTLVAMTQAQTLSQQPLLTKSSALPSNLLLILDDSGSMDAQYLYQYGGTGGGMGLPGPGNGSGQVRSTCPPTLDINTTCTYNPTPITLTNTTPPTPAAWNSTTNYASNAYVLGSDNKVYQCQDTSGCGAGINPTIAPATPPTWTATSYAYSSVVLKASDGHVYNCTRSGGCTSGNVPGVNPRWDDLGTLADYLNAFNQWSSPGIPLATYLSTGGTNTGSGRFWVLSPDVNRITYDPRIRYRVRLTGTGTTTTTPATPVTTASFYVFFYGNGGSVTPKMSQIWNGTNTYGDPATYGSYFAPYTAANQATNSTSVLAVGATPGLSYPQCVGPCTGVPSSLVNSSGNFPKFAARDDCTGTVCTLANEQQNYANWKKFHSNRMELAKTGIGYAFQNAGSNMRIGWAQISDLDNNPTDLGPAGAGVSQLTQTQKTTFYNWLYARRPSSGTPLRDALIAAGKYFSRSDNLGPWADTPDASSKSLTNPSGYAADSSHKTCRRSYTMMLTDGYYNGADTGLDDVDITAVAAIPGFTSSGAPIPPASQFSYNGTTKPYAATSTVGTMADIAMKYWITDLRSDLTNNVVPNAANPSYWQNMGFYGIGLGIDGTLPQTPATLASLTSGALSWPNPPAGGNTPATIDDMWHATINARGRMMSARNADALSDAVENMLAEIAKVTDSQAGVAASTASLITGTRKYSPLYTTGSWVGNIVATELDPANAADICIKWQITGPLLQSDPNTNVVVPPACTGFTSDLIPPHTSRYVYSWNGSGYGNFNSSNSHVQGNIVGGSTASLIDFLRGDSSNEDTALASSLYRQRATKFGDVVNSTPTLVKGAVDMGYSNLPANTLGQASYQTFVQNKALREGVLFAGANDGMLHGFRDTTGAEVFAFVPKAVMPNLHLLASRSYKHQFYVDGPTTEVDACLGAAVAGNCTASEWKNLILGTLGAGGKSVFAIDVTTVNSSLPNLGMGASNIKWEITSSDALYANLGHIFSPIQTGVTTGGKWVAIFGNGYYGADGSAHLYVADLNTGARLQDIDTNVGGGNGLSAVTLVRNSNQQIIGAYAGDLAGNLWKFDLSDANEANWKLATNNTPANNGKLFAPISAGKPITAAPAFVPHPLGGRVVVFGTGKFFDVEDLTISGTQDGFKGIWDSVEFGTNSPSTDTQTNNANLVQQTTTGPITGTYTSTSYSTGSPVTSTVTYSAYKQSSLTIDWTTKRGWYMDIPTAFSGERLVFPMVRLFSATSRLVLANTIAPTTVNPCTSGQVGGGHSYIFDLLSGARPDNSLTPGCPDCTIMPTPPVPPVVICRGLSCYALTPTGDPGGGGYSPNEWSGKCGAQTGVACPPGSGVKRSWRKLHMR